MIYCDVLFHSFYLWVYFLTSTSLLTWWNLVSNDSQQLHQQNKGLQTSHAEADTLIIQKKAELLFYWRVGDKVLVRNVTWLPEISDFIKRFKAVRWFNILNVHSVNFSQNLKSFISQLSSDFRNNKLQKHQENVQHFHLFKFRKDVKREFLCRNNFVNKNVQVTENAPVVSRLLDVETQSWTVVCGRTEPWHQPERSFCLFVFWWLLFIGFSE